MASFFSKRVVVGWERRFVTPRAAIFGLLLLALGAVAWPVHAQTASAPAPGAAFFYSGGRAHSLKLSTRWAAAQLAANASPRQLTTRLAPLTATDATTTSLYYAHHNIALVPVATQARLEARDQLKTAIQQAPGVHRPLRVFENGNYKYPIIETEEFLIQFRPGVSASQAAALLKPYNAVLDHPLGSYAPNGYDARVTDAAHTAMDVSDALALNPSVIFAHPNFIWPKQPRHVPNDPLFPQQWNLNNTGQNGGMPGADIKAEQAWDITRGDTRIVIAVIDTGIDYTHEEFRNKLVGPFDEITKSNDPSPQDGGNGDENHGTAAAGLAVASGDNGVGISGVAPFCSFMPIRAVVAEETLEDEADAFRYAADHGADVISNSWGPTDGTGMAQPMPDATRRAIDYAVTHGRGGKGCVIFFAAGNGSESSDLDGYASNAEVISVAASTNQDQHAPYSDTGTTVGLCAPSSSGVSNITTTDRTGAPGFDPGNYTSSFGGTSACAPQAAGVAGLVLSVNPNLTYTQVRDVLENSADKIDASGGGYDATGHSSLYGYGRLNAFKAVQNASATPVTVKLVAPTTGSTVVGNYQLKATTSNDSAVQHVDFYRRSEGANDSFSRTPNLAIPDQGQVSDTQTLTSTGTIEQASVTIDIDHPSPEDLVVTLFAPDGTSTVLFNHSDTFYTTDTGSGISIIAPLNWTGKKIGGTWRLQVADTVAQDTGTLVDWSLDFRAKWNLIGSATAPTNGAWVANWATGPSASTPLGIYAVRAVAVSSTVNAEAVNDNVNVVAGTFVLTGRISNTDNNGLTGVSVNITSPTGTVSPVTVTTNSQGIFSVPNVGPGQYLIKPTLPGNGFTPTSRTVTVTNGNVGGIDFVAAPVLPVPTITVTRPAAAPNNFYTSLTSAAGTASDDAVGAGIAGVTGLLYRYANGTTPAGFWTGTTWSATYSAAVNERPAIGTTSWTVALPALVPGKYSFRATVKDKAGHTASSNGTTFVIDRTGPAITLLRPAVAPDNAYSRLASAAGLVSDVGGSGVAQVTGLLYRYPNGTTPAGFWTGTTWSATYSAAVNERPATGTTSWTVALPALDPGRYSFRASATDRVGNLTHGNGTTFIIDRSAPIVTVTNPATNSYTSLTTANGTASDPSGGGIAQVTVLLFRFGDEFTPAGYWNGSDWSTSYSPAANERLAHGTTSWSEALPALAPGKYWVRATATDNAGNTASSTVTFIIVTAGNATATKNVAPLLSSVTANRAAFVQLRFSGPLDNVSAGDAIHYQATVDGRPSTVESASYGGGNVVTLSLAATALPPGAVVTVTYSGLADGAGHTLPAGTAQATVH